MLRIAAAGSSDSKPYIAVSPYQNKIQLHIPYTSHFSGLVEDDVEQLSHPALYFITDVKNKAKKVAIQINYDRNKSRFYDEKIGRFYRNSLELSKHIGELNNIDYSYFMMDFLAGQGVPFVIKYLYIEVSTPIQENGSKEDSYELNLAELEYPDYGDLKIFASQLYKMEMALETKLRSLYKIFFYISHAIGLANHKQVLHGNICPENILLRSCSLGQINVCPMIAGWDMSFNIEIPSNYMKYTPRYRPLEMTLFQDVNIDEIYTALGGYKYSKTEDGYAFAITMIDTMVAAGISKEQMQGVTTMLNDLLYPWTVEEVFELHINSVEELMSKSDIVEKFDQILNPKYIEIIREFKAFYESSEQEIINDDIDTDKMINDLKSQDISSVSIIRNFINYNYMLKTNNNGNIFERLDELKKNKFSSLLTNLSENTIFKDDLSVRRNMFEVSKRLYTLIHPELSEKSNDEIDQLVKNEIEKSQNDSLGNRKITQVEYLKTDPNDINIPELGKHSDTAMEDIFMKNNDSSFIFI